MGRRQKAKEWEREFDARLRDPSVKKDVMANWGLLRPREVRVEDDEGTMRRRNGDGCCGCGRWHSTQETPTWSGPVVTHHHAEAEHHHEAPQKSWWARQRDK